MEGNKFKINVNDNLFKVDISNLTELILQLKGKEEDLKIIVESLCSIIKRSEEKIKKLEEEKKETNIKINK